MFHIIVVLPKPEDAKGIRNLLIKNGFHVDSVCATGSQALSRMDDFNDGLVICSYRMSDMMYSELHACLPKGFEMLLLASANILRECDLRNIMSLAMPLKVHDLINTAETAPQRAQRAGGRTDQGGEGASDEPQSYDGGGSPPLFAKMQHGQRYQSGGGSPDGSRHDADVTAARWEHACSV